MLFCNKVKLFFWMESFSINLLGTKSQRRKQNIRETNSLRQIYTISDTHTKIIECHLF